MNTNDISKNLSVSISENDYSKINHFIEEGLYENEETFLREALNGKLGEIEVINLRDISRNQAKKEIYEYCKEKKQMNLEDIADDLKLDIFEVNEIVNEFIESGNIKEV